MKWHLRLLALAFSISALMGGEHKFRSWHGDTLASGPAIFYPVTNPANPFELWTPVGAATRILALQKPSTVAGDGSYIWAPLFNPVSISLYTFSSDLSHLHGTPRGVRFSVRAAPYGIAGQTGGSRDLYLTNLLTDRVFLVASIPALNVLGPGTFVTYTITSTTDPRTGLVWTLAGISSLLSEGFGPEATAVPIGTETGIAISNFFIEPLVSNIPGQGGFRLGPLREENVFVCIICGEPFHRSDLIKVRDSRHPHYGQWVCPADLDEIDPEPQGPRFTEGDLDADED